MKTVYGYSVKKLMDISHHISLKPDGIMMIGGKAIQLFTGKHID